MYFHKNISLYKKIFFFLNSLTCSLFSETHVLLAVTLPKLHTGCSSPVFCSLLFFNAVPFWLVHSTIWTLNLCLFCFAVFRPLRRSGGDRVDLALAVRHREILSRFLSRLVETPAGLVRTNARRWGEKKAKTSVAMEKHKDCGNNKKKGGLCKYFAMIYTGQIGHSVCIPKTTRHGVMFFHYCTQTDGRPVVGLQILNTAYLNSDALCEIKYIQ